MSFWGMSKAGKEANGWAREHGAWSKDQYGKLIPEMWESWNKGQDLSDWATDYQKRRTERGFGDPNSIREKGKEIMPGLDDVLTRRWGRLEGIGQMYDSYVPSVGKTMDQYNEALLSRGRDIGKTQDAVQNEILRHSTDANIYQGDAHNKSVADINATYGGAKSDVIGEYGGLRKQNAQVGDEIGRDTQAAYQKASKTLEMMRPGSTQAEARVARSYAPAIAAAAGRLRRAGVDPNSLQASEVMAGAERDRARAQEDSASQWTNAFVDKSNALDLGLNDAVARNKYTTLNNEIGLGTDQVGMTTALDRERGQEYRGEVGRNAAILRDIDQGRANATIGNLNTGFERSNDWWKDRGNQALLERDLGTQDWQTRSNLMREQNDEEMNQINARDNQYQRGLQWQANDLSERNAGANQVAAQGAQQTSAAMQAGNMARGFGQDADAAYKTAYEREAANAGWGTKMLLGVGSMAADYFLPGSGQIIRGAMGGGQQQPGGGGGWGGDGGFGTGSWGSNPMIMSAMEPSYNVAPTPQWNNYSLAPQAQSVQPAGQSLWPDFRKLKL